MKNSKEARRQPIILKKGAGLPSGAIKSNETEVAKCVFF